MKNENDIEQEFRHVKNMVLSPDEHASIKHALLTHAKKTIPHRTHHSWSFLVMNRLAPLCGVLLITFFGTGYASYDSLPGDSLYAMKIHVVEELFSASKLDPNERTAYEISRMDTRLQELRAISESNVTLSTEELEAVANQIDEHASHIASTIRETDESVIPHEEKLNTLTKLNGYAKAQAQIINENSELAPIADNIHASEEHIADALTLAADEFSEESPLKVNEYLSTHIQEVTEDLTATTTDQEVRDQAERHVQNVDESLAEGDTTTALISVLEAQQTIAADELLAHTEAE